MNQDLPTEPGPDDVRRMISLLVDGELSSEEAERLEATLLADAAARDEYREFMVIEAILSWELAAESQRCGQSVAEDRGGGAEVRPAPLAASGKRRSWFVRLPRRALRVLALAGLVLLAAWVGSWLPAPGRVAPPAVLTESDQARWSLEGGLAVGDRLPDGPLTLLEGTAQIWFRSGAIVTLDPGAEIEVLGDNRLFLRAGRITPFVPAAARGFTVVSPSGEVIDLGTEFSIGVGPDGTTDVLVIDGQVDVASGHAAANPKVRLSQGFATEFAAFEPIPQLTQQPLVIDDFSRVGGALRWRDHDAGHPAVVRDGGLEVPIDGRPGRDRSFVQVELTNDFQTLVGRAATISFKVTLPENDGLHPGRWLALVIDRREQPRLPGASDEDSAVAVMVSPLWQASVRIDGEPLLVPRLFPRSEEAVGPYQVVMRLDDSPRAHAAHGSAVVGVMINGREVVKNQPFALGPRPRLTLQTWVRPGEGGHGHVLLDDFCVSVAMGEPTGGEP